jgi:hypothetical protein
MDFYSAIHFYNIQPAIMRIFLLLCTLVFSAPAWCSSANSIASHANAPVAQYQANSKKLPGNGLEKPLRERKLFYKGKGTMGLILSLVLGPVGYVGVHIFSHNKAMRDKADTGFAIWIGTAIIGLLIWQSIESKVTLDDVLGYAFAILQGLGS